MRIGWGSFKNHVDKKGWVGGQPNVHSYPQGDLKLGSCKPAFGDS